MLRVSPLSVKHFDFRIKQTQECGKIRKAPEIIRAPLRIPRQRPTLPQGHPSSTIGARGLNYSVRNGKRCFPSAITTGRNPMQLQGMRERRRSIEHWSSRTAISTSRLNGSLPHHLHLWPIDLVIFKGPLGAFATGHLVLRWASCLDAFSGYPFHT